MFRVKYRFMEETTGGEEGSGGGATTTTTEPVVTTTPAATTTPPASTTPATTTAPAATVTTTPVVTESKTAWGEDWREKLAKGDEKKLKSLQRFASPEALTDSYMSAAERIRSGELKTVLPKDAKPEELAAWRKENGIPETPDKYDLTFESGLVIGCH